MTTLMTAALTSTPRRVCGETAPIDHCADAETAGETRATALKRLLRKALYSLSVRHPSPSDQAMRDISSVDRPHR